MSAALYVVSTPIGNLEDLSYRAVRILQSVDVIAAEDTRVTQTLLQHYHILTPTVSLHAHNETHASAHALKRLAEGASWALLSDAGTPLICDPGFVLVRDAKAAGIPVVPIPGPCAFITALQASGIPTNALCFQGFFPTKATQQTQLLAQLARTEETYVFYEAPHRILERVHLLSNALAEDRMCTLARELTKRFEQITTAPLATIREALETGDIPQKGEFVMIIAPAGAQEKAQTTEISRVLEVLLPVMSLKQAVQCAIELTGAPKNQIYPMALEMNRASASE